MEKVATKAEWEKGTGFGVVPFIRSKKLRGLQLLPDAKCADTAVSTFVKQETHVKTVSKDGKGKTLYIRLSVFPCGGADPSKNLTISCSDKDTQFKTTLSDHGLRKFREQVLAFYKTHVLEKNIA